MAAQTGPRVFTFTWAAGIRSPAVNVWSVVNSPLTPAELAAMAPPAGKGEATRTVTGSSGSKDRTWLLTSRPKTRRDDAWTSTVSPGTTPPRGKAARVRPLPAKLSSSVIGAGRRRTFAASQDGRAAGVASHTSIGKVPIRRAFQVTSTGHRETVAPGGGSSRPGTGSPTRPRSFTSTGKPGLPATFHGIAVP